MYAPCVSGAVNTQGFVRIFLIISFKTFLCALYKISFIHSKPHKQGLCVFISNLSNAPMTE